MKGEPHLLVVGNGGAAAHAVMAARQAGHSGPILRRPDWTEHLPRLSGCVEAGEMDRILALMGV